jgi:hypothetical protein
LTHMVISSHHDIAHALTNCDHFTPHVQYGSYIDRVSDQFTP